MDRKMRFAAALAAALLGLVWALPCFAFSVGDSGEAVTALQRALYALGYTDSAPDGWYGQRTSQAAQRLMNYAQAAGLNLTEAQLADAWASGQLQPVTGTVKAGDVSEAVLLTQRRLRALGYLADKADGRFGANTQRALMVFQHDQGLAPTGEVDELTRPKLFAIDAQPAAHGVLVKGMQDERVLEMQNRLWQLGFFTGDLDGQYGSQTVVGVKALQTYIQTCGKFDWDSRLLNMDFNGIADPLLLAAIYGDFPLPSPMKQSDSGQDVYRLQRRLIALGYLDQAPDGGYGENTLSAVRAFQKRAGLNGKGQATQQTVELLFSEGAPEAIRPYKLVVDLSDQRLYVYQWDGGAYGKLRYTMECSTGPDVAAGSYRQTTRPGEKWLEMRGAGWVADCFLLEAGLLIHSVPYDQQEGRVNTALLSALGAPSAVGGITVNPENARLIYEKCAARTPVDIVQ